MAASVDGPALKHRGRGADPEGMGRSVIGLCAVAGSTIGGCVPMAWGDSGFSLVSVVAGLLGAIGGVWVGVRVSDV
jgi:hypothetical protein